MQVVSRKLLENNHLPLESSSLWIVCGHRCAGVRWREGPRQAGTHGPRWGKATYLSSAARLLSSVATASIEACARSAAWWCWGEQAILRAKSNISASKQEWDAVLRWEESRHEKAGHQQSATAWSKWVLAGCTSSPPALCEIEGKPSQWHLREWYDRMRSWRHSSWRRYLRWWVGFGRRLSSPRRSAAQTRARFFALGCCVDLA
jgi:hypothetical protein